MGSRNSSKPALSRALFLGILSQLSILLLASIQHSEAAGILSGMCGSGAGSISGDASFTGSIEGIANAESAESGEFEFDGIDGEGDMNVEGMNMDGFNSSLSGKGEDFSVETEEEITLSQCGVVEEGGAADLGGTATGKYALAVGGIAEGSNSTAIGSGSTASETGAVAIIQQQGKQIEEQDKELEQARQEMQAQREQLDKQQEQIDFLMKNMRIKASRTGHENQKEAVASK